MVVRATTKNYNRLFNSLILNEVLTTKELVDSLVANSEATTYIPDNEEVKRGFTESKLTNLQTKGILYFIESAIRPSASSTHHLGFNQYSLEHMMPKKWRNHWELLDNEAALNRDRALLTLGNLAIITSSLNSSIRDADWDTKRWVRGARKASKPVRKESRRWATQPTRTSGTNLLSLSEGCGWQTKPSPSGQYATGGLIRSPMLNENRNGRIRETF